MITDNNSKLRHEKYQLLIQQADNAVENGNFEIAEACYYQGLEIFPAKSGILGKMGHMYKQLEREEDANLCFRGVVPDAANQQFYDSSEQSERVLDQAVAIGCTTLSAYPPEKISLKPAVQHGASTSYNNFRFHQTECRGSFTTRVKGGQVWFDGFNTVAFDCDRHIIRQHIKGNEFLVNKSLANLAPVKLDGRVCFLDARSSPIYYHWMLDVLPKLQILRQSGIELDSIDQFLVRTHSSFQTDTLACFGIDPSKIRQLDGDTLYSADEMLFPYLKNDLGDKLLYGLGLGLASWIPDFLQKHILTPNTGHAQQVPAGQKRRLFISRQDSQTRRIENEQEVTELFDHYGLETVTFSGISVPEQARLMQDAELVVGVHGAGFTNLAFCQEGTKVLELFGSYIVPCYWSLSNLAGLDYHNFMCEESIIGAEHDVIVRRDKDIIVDISELDATLRTLTETKSSVAT